MMVATNMYFFEVHVINCGSYVYILQRKWIGKYTRAHFKHSSYISRDYDLLRLFFFKNPTFP